LDIPVYAPVTGEAPRVQAPGVENPTGAVALKDAVSLALLYSPELAAFQWETRAREARIVQAGRPPNPVVGVLLEDLGAGGKTIDPSSGGLVQPQTTIQLSQLIELGGKRTAREQFATLTRDLALWDYEAARINTLTEVTRAFIDVLAAQQLVDLSTQTMKLVEETQQTVGARVTAGVVSPIEQTRAEVALASARIDSDRATRLLDAARRRLAAFWGAEPRFDRAAGDLAERPPLPPFADLQARLSNNPVLARWATEISQRQAAFAVERSKGTPDLTITAGYRRFTDIDSNALIVGASIPLPMFDKNKGAIEDAQMRVNKAYEEQRAAQVTVSAALAESYRALAAADQELTVLRSSVLPGSRQTFEAVSEGYRLGRFGYLEVLDAQRTLIAAGGQSLRALSEYHKAAADVERLTGAPLNGMSSTTAKE
jgi:cobalt-zinc-cadmium efflux system outer membrane protein